MIALTHFEDDAPDFAERAQAALTALAGCHGYLRGVVARSTDDGDEWMVLTEWRDVGSYRRALGTFAVKMHATPLLATARPLPGGFETLIDVAPGGSATLYPSDREATR